MTVFQRSKPVRSGEPTADRQAGLESGRVSGRVWFAVLLIIVTIAPTAWSFNVGPLRLTVYRIVLLCAAPVVVPWLMTAKDRCFADWLLPLGYFCSFIATTVHHGPEFSVESQGVLALEACVAYAVARYTLRSTSDLVRLMSVIGPLYLCYGLAAVVESVAGQPFIHLLLTGRPGASSTNDRFGFMRSYGSFDHPIAAGVNSGIILGLGIVATTIRGGKGFLKFCLGGLLACMASLSSAAAMFLAVIAISFSWAFITRRTQHRWWIFFALLVVAWLGLDLLSNRSPMTVLISYLTFSPHTGYGRQLIWQYGFWENAVPNPLFGIGYSDWVRPSWMYSGSLDNFWLYNAMRFGMPAGILILANFITCAWIVGRASETRWGRISPQVAWVVTMAAAIMAAATVHFFNQSLVIFAFFAGTGLAMIPSSASSPRATTQRVSAVHSRHRNGKARS